MEDQALERYKLFTLEEMAHLKIVVRPWINTGDYDHRYYGIKITLPPQLPLDLALVYIQQKWWTIMITTGDKTSVDNSILRIIVKLNSEEEMMIKLDDHTTLGEYACRISHKLLYQYKKCNGKGHWENQCENLQIERGNFEKTMMQLQRLCQTKEGVNSTIMKCTIRYDDPAIRSMAEKIYQRPREHSSPTTDNQEHLNLTERQAPMSYKQVSIQNYL